MGTFKNRIVKSVMIVLGIAVLMLQFNNCSKYKQNMLQDNSSSNAPNESMSEAGVADLTPTGDEFEDELRKTFALGFYKFGRAQCYQCHTSDSNKPQFASRDINWAYTVFMSKGYTRFSNNAISPTHQPPASGSHHTQKINELKLEWQQALAEYNRNKGLPPEEANKNPSEILNYETSSKVIPTMTIGQERQVTWNLNSIDEFGPMKVGVSSTTFGGTVQFSILVGRHRTNGGADYYTVRSPSILNNAMDIKVKTLYVKINGRLVTYTSTFKYAEADIHDVTTQSSRGLTGLISTGGLVVLGEISPADEIGVAFEKLEPAVLQDPPPPVSVGFQSGIAGNTSGDATFVGANADIAIADLNSGTLNFNIRGMGNVTAPVVLSVEEIGDNASYCGAAEDVAFNLSSTCMPELRQAMIDRGLGDARNLTFKRAKSIVGTSFNRFDWDYKFNVTTVNLLGQDPVKGVKVTFSKDLRREENNRLLRLRIVVASNNAIVSKQIVNAVLLKADNPEPASGEITFSRLMMNSNQVSGILNTNCVKCHNSRDLNGGYDMTDYDLMVNNRVLVPSPDPTISLQSKMYRRLNANDPGNENLTPMPLDAFMPTLNIQMVEEWIRNGAKNN